MNPTKCVEQLCFDGSQVKVAKKAIQAKARSLLFFQEVSATLAGRLIGNLSGAYERRPTVAKSTVVLRDASPRGGPSSAHGP